MTVSPATMGCTSDRGTPRSPGRSLKSFSVPTKGSNNFASLFFLLLFPCFYIYHYGLARGLYPPLVAGWFGPVSVVVASVMGLFLLRDLSQGLARRGFGFMLGFLLFLGYTVAVALSHVLFGEQAIMVEAQRQYVATAIGWLALFGIGFYLRWTERLLAWSSLFFYAMVIIAWWHIDVGRMMFYAAQVFEVTDGIATYQGFARSFVLISMLLLAYETKLANQMFTAAVASATLFILGARAEWAGFLAVVAVWFFLGHRQSGWRFRILVIVLFIAVGLAATMVPSLTSSRQLELVDIFSSTSWEGRVGLLASGWGDILENPLLGNFGGHIRASSVGGYIHNVLSAWHAFGLLGFLLYFGMSIAAFVGSALVVLRRNASVEEAKLALFVTFFSLILIVAAKSIYWQVPALGWGLTAGLFRNAD